MKLLKYEGEPNQGKTIVEIGVYLLVLNFLCAVGVWQSILNGWKVAGEGMLFSQAYIRAGESISFVTGDRNTCYIYFLSVLFTFLGNKEGIVPIINLCLLAAGVFFFYCGTKRFMGFIPSLIASVGMGIAGGCSFSVVTDNSMHLLWFMTAVLFWLEMEYITAFAAKQEYASRLRAGVLGIAAGVLCYIDFIGFCLVLTAVLIMGTVRERGKLEKLLCMLLMLMSICATVLVLAVVLDMQRGENIALVMSRWFSIRVSMASDSSTVGQYTVIAGFFVYIFILLGWYMYKTKGRKRAVAETQIDVVQAIEEITQSIAEKNRLDESIALQISWEKMVPLTETVQEKAEQAMQSIEKTAGESVKEPAQEPAKKTIKFLDNPLPVPKKHVKKEMNYAFEPPKELMHYDLNNYNVNDDYDLK